MNEPFLSFLNIQFSLTDIQNEVPAIIAFFTIIVIYQLLKTLILRRLSTDSENRFIIFISDQVGSFSWVTAILTAAYISVQLSVGAHPQVKNIIYILFLGIWIIEFVQLVNSVIEFAFRKTAMQATGHTSVSMYRILERMTKGAVWLVAGLVILSNVGIDITGLIAGLGIGGLAVALALQSVLSDFIATISVISDKPFIVGDFIIVGDFMGTVERIGLRSSRIRSIDGELIVYPNSQLVNATIRNFGSVERRRSLIRFGILYSTNPELVKDIPVFVHDILVANHSVDNEEFRANFVKFGDSALEFEVQFFALTQDYTEFLKIQQEVLYGIKDKFEEEGIEMAFPTQTVHLEK